MSTMFLSYTLVVTEKISVYLGCSLNLTGCWLVLSQWVVLNQRWLNWERAESTRMPGSEPLSLSSTRVHLKGKASFNLRTPKIHLKVETSKYPVHGFQLLHVFWVQSFKFWNVSRVAVTWAMLLFGESGTLVGLLVCLTAAPGCQEDAPSCHHQILPSVI